MRNIFQTLYRRPGKPWRPARGPGSAPTISFPVALAFMLSGIGGQSSVRAPIRSPSWNGKSRRSPRAGKAVPPRSKASARNCIGSRRPVRSTAPRASQPGKPTMRWRAPNKPMPLAMPRIATRRCEKRRSFTASIDGTKRTLAASLRAPVIENVLYRTGWCAGASALRDRFCQQSF